MSSGVPRQVVQQKFTDIVQEIICPILKEDESFTLDFTLLHSITFH